MIFHRNNQQRFCNMKLIKSSVFTLHHDKDEQCFHVTHLMSSSALIMNLCFATAINLAPHICDANVYIP